MQDVEQSTTADADDVNHICMLMSHNDTETYIILLSMSLAIYL